jgi:hypothetical protein
VRGFRQKFTLEDAIGSHACSLEANTRVTNGIPLGSSLLLPVEAVNCVQTLKENVLFHEAVEEVRKVPADMLVKKATGIYNKFVKPGAHKSINIKSETTKSIKEEWEKKAFHPTMFAAAQKEIYYLMKVDSYPRFLKSEAYTDLVVASANAAAADASGGGAAGAGSAGAGAGAVAGEGMLVKTKTTTMLVSGRGSIGSTDAGASVGAYTPPAPTGGASTASVPSPEKSPTKGKKRGFKLFGRKKEKKKERPASGHGDSATSNVRCAFNRQAFTFNVYRQASTFEDAIEVSHAFAPLQALPCVWSMAFLSDVHSSHRLAP